jgi:hypothetical protein
VARSSPSEKLGVLVDIGAEQANRCFAGGRRRLECHRRGLDVVDGRPTTVRRDPAGVWPGNLGPVRLMVSAAVTDANADLL